MDAVQQGQVGAAIQIAVARKSLDQAERQGDAMVGLLEDAARFAAETRGSVSPSPASTETGRMLDMVA
ncbi:MAG: putative motility protein [Phycisphaerales bacterium]|nr:MAG: putative motility protein [Phycisphaerales bacterium]